MGSKKGSLWKNHTYVEKLCLVCNALTRNKKFCSNPCRSIGMKGIDCSGYHQGFKGKKHTSESLELMSIASKAAGERGAHRWNSENNYSKIHGNANKGIKLSEDRKAELSEQKKEFYRNGGQLTIHRPGFYAEDLGHFVRSLWEANIARLFKFMQIEYAYEPKRFDLGKTTYLPDFYVPFFESYIEIKGKYRGIEDLSKAELFAEKYPMIIIDSSSYKNITSEFSKIVPNWGKRG